MLQVFYLYGFFKSQVHEHPTDDNPDVYNWSEITGQHTQTLHITDAKAINDHWSHDQLQLLRKLFDHCDPPSKHYPKWTMLNFRDRS